MSHRNTFFSIILFVFFIFADQLTKYIIRSFGGFYICNKGVAFGIVLPLWLILLLAIALIAFIGLVTSHFQFPISNKFLNQNFKFKNLALISNLKFKTSNLALALILSGAISNLIDRVYYGCVIDFIDLKVWPIFNLADVFICFGVFLFIMKLKSTSP
jgi:lipoprotein signal peptidase